MYFNLHRRFAEAQKEILCRNEVIILCRCLNSALWEVLVAVVVAVALAVRKPLEVEMLD